MNEYDEIMTKFNLHLQEMTFFKTMTKKSVKMNTEYS